MDEKNKQLTMDKIMKKFVCTYRAVVSRFYTISCKI